MSKGGGKTVNTVQQADPWRGQQPYLSDLFSRAQGLSGNQNIVAGQSPYTQQAISGMANSATDPNSLSGKSAAELGKTVSGEYLKADSNPYLQGAMNNAMNDIQGRVAGTFGTRGGNNYGSSAHQEWLGRSLTEAAAPILAQNYQAERGNQLNAAALGPQLEAARTGQLASAGAQQDAYQQRLLDSPWDILQRYQGIVNGNYGGSSTGTQPYSGTSPLADVAGLGLTGMGIYSLGKGAGLWGAAAAASDRRLKRDIQVVGKNEKTGLAVYSFKYLHDDTPRLGYMADEVEKVMPEAVVTDARGFKAVKYGMLEA